MPEEMRREERRRETTTTFSAGVDVERQLRPPAPQAAELEGLSLRRGGGGRRPLAGPASRVPTALFLPLSSGALTLSLSLRCCCCCHCRHCPSRPAESAARPGAFFPTWLGAAQARTAARGPAAAADAAVDRTRRGHGGARARGGAGAEAGEKSRRQSGRRGRGDQRRAKTRSKPSASSSSFLSPSFPSASRFFSSLPRAW